MTDPEREPDSNPEDKVPLRERPIHEVAGVLQEFLGQRLVAYGIGERNPQRVGSFARSEEVPEEEAEKVLRDLAEVTEVLTERNSPEIARAIMIGMNSNLDGQAPIEVMHDGESERVVASARYLLAD